MVRPPASDWEVLGLTEDPTPGNPEILRKLADEYQRVSDEAESAFDVIRRIKDSNLGSGKAMSKLKEVIGKELPTQVGALRDSYDKAAKAIGDYVPLLRDHQRDADRALRDGRDAKTRLDGAVATAAAASAALTTLDNGPRPPDDDKAAQGERTRALNDARRAVSSADGAVATAQSELDAARLLATQAWDARIADAGTAATAMGVAEDDAVRQKNFWNKLWDKIGSAFGIFSAILGVLSFLVPGLQGLGLLLGGLSLLTGLVPLSINITRGVVAGNWDVLGIVLGVVGTAFGGYSLLNGLGKTFGPWLKGAGGARPGTPPGTPPRPGSSHTPPGTPPGTPPRPGSSHTPPGSPPPSRPPSSSGSSADDFRTPPTSPRPSSDGSATPPNSPRPSSDDFFTPPQSPPRTPEGTRPGTPSGTPSGTPRPSVGSPPPSVGGTRPPSPAPSTPVPPGLPNLADELATVFKNVAGVNTSSLGQWLANMGNAARGNIPGAIGASTALIGSFYAPIATAGHAPGSVAHGNPLVGNTNQNPPPTTPLRP